MDTKLPRQTDNAFLGRDLKGGSHEPTYAGALSFMRRRYSRDLNGVDLAIWGIPFDASVSNRPGARFGPQGVRRASAIFDGDPQYPFEFDPFEVLSAVDYGDCVFDYGENPSIPGHIQHQATGILDAGTHLFSIGGDHFVTFPLLKAHAAKHGPLALVQFDAHQDTWDDKGNRIDHGTFVGRAVREGLIDPDRSIQIGIRTHAPETCGIEMIYGYQMDSLGIQGVIDRIVDRAGAGPAYMTFDIDCLDPAFAPGTGTPVAGGLSSREALSILRGLGEVNFVGGDVVEVAPAYDHADITSIAGASVALTYIGLLAEKRRMSD
ncbi:agmatinase [Roseibium sp. RKSG952]|uniref:agmatinase n=1 Tax=Roseibium sp. RKSG952 TaxID=2529384 RepID=UPI0012BCFBA8|nr:agmatinase [Roseibium sp. RKSG952]MTH98304.1 agmatinase [Roseibium sp. RKSG952]